ncbi:MAG: hypothetical protein ABSC94_10980 [Polyangiaceae bacterium]|jgi:hypothetical protein
MKANRPIFALLVLGLLLVLGAASCNTERKEECEQFLLAMKALEDSPASTEVADRTLTTLASISFKDEPLREYASSTKTTLTVLSNTLKVQASPSPPDGTDELVAAKMKEARGEREDVARYCLP